MRIISGIFDHMVMQRNANGLCEQRIYGECSVEKQIFVRLPNGEQELFATCSADGRFCGILRGLQTGGPYQISLRAGQDEIVFSDILVGDVWMLAGQSNMQGIGNMQEALPPCDAVRAFYLDNHWRVACDPLHDFSTAAAEIHWILSGGHDAFKKNPVNPLKGVGPGVSFGQTLETKTGVPQGLIASAHGGTTLTQWAPELKTEGENSLYGAMYERFVMNGSKIAGVLWYQGCSDSTREDNVEQFTTRTLALFKAMRRDFGDDALPIILVQIGRTATIYGDFAFDNRWSRIREQQRGIPQMIEHCVMIPTMDLEMDDPIHLSGSAQMTLGQRMADAVLYLKGDTQGYPPLKIGRLEYVEKKECKEYQTVIHVEHVVGTLHSGNLLPSAFSLHEKGAENKLSAPPYRCRLEGNRIILSSASPWGCKVAYAFGAIATGNVYDAAMRPLPAFGPLYSHAIYRSTPMLSEVEVSEPVMGIDHFEALSANRKNISSLHFTRVGSSQPHIEFERIMNRGDYVRFVRWRCLCGRKMACRLLFGCDSDFRLFCDDREILDGKNVANPIVPDEFSADMTLEKGEHEFSMGLSGKAGNAWGFCCRFVDCNDILTTQNENQRSDNLPVFL